MKTAKWLAFVFLLAGIALAAAACGGEEAPPASPTSSAPPDTAAVPTATQAPIATSTPNPSPTPEPTATAEPTAEPALDLSDLSTAEELDSYRSTTSIMFSGTKDGKQVEATTELLLEFTRNPRAQHMSITSTSTEQITGTGTIELYQVGDMQYMRLQDQWMSVPVTDTADLATEGLLEGDDVINDACGWKKKGNERLDGIEVERWTLPKEGADQCLVALEVYDQGELTGAGGDVYIAREGRYVARMSIYVEGTGLSMFGASAGTVVDEGRMEITYTMSDVNEPFTIEVPEEALKGSQLPEDIPTPADAEGVSQVFGMITFTSATPPGELSDFYKTEMPKNGWTLSNEGSFGGVFSLEFTKGGRTASLMISADAAPGKTSVLITVQGE